MMPALRRFKGRPAKNTLEAQRRMSGQSQEESRPDFKHDKAANNNYLSSQGKHWVSTRRWYCKETGYA